MTIKFRKLVALAALSVCICSCSSEMENAETNLSANSGENEVKAQISAFLAGSSTRAASDVKINTVTRTDYAVVDGNAVEAQVTRSMTGDSFTLATVEFSANGKEGFAILSENTSEDGVCYITEEGSLGDIENIAPLKDYVEGIPQLVADEMSGIYTNLTPVEARTVEPLVKYKWGQGYPFNLGAPVCVGSWCDNDEMRGHKFAGCVPLAIAELMATIKCISPYSFIDLDNLPLTNADVEESQIENIRRFMTSVCNACVKDFGCKDTKNHTQTSGDLFKAYQYLLSHFYDCEYVPTSLNEARMYEELKKGIPHIICGADSKKNVGHCWLIDGIRDTNSGTLYHCVWGWDGNSDGWLKGNYYTAVEKGDVYDTGYQQIYINAMPMYLQTGPIK